MGTDLRHYPQNPPTRAAARRMVLHAANALVRLPKLLAAA